MCVCVGGGEGLEGDEQGRTGQEAHMWKLDFFAYIVEVLVPFPNLILVGSQV